MVDRLRGRAGAVLPGDLARRCRESLLRAVHQTRGEAREVQLPLLRYVRESRDPNVKMVLFEDTAARVDFADGLNEDEIERASETIEHRLRDVVPDVTEVFLDATTAPTKRRRQWQDRRSGQSFRTTDY
jgi:hypothetical protein